VAISQSGELIGCGQIRPHQEGIFELASIAVHPDFRHKGVARAIIESLLTRVNSPLYLVCRSDLSSMYKKFRFRAITGEELPLYFRRLIGISKRLLPVELTVMKRDAGG
jgi:N-acetylglutamate synthase-like GNAT family acetyltransferase